MRHLIFHYVIAPVFSEQVFDVFESGRKYGMRVKALYDEANAEMPDSLIGDSDMRRTGCKAIQMSDQMVCRSCGLNWDMNDPEPPECRNKHSVKVESTVKPTTAYAAFKNNLLLMKQQLGGK